ncbi:DNA mismatch repair protein, putative [Theileria equi strain WA]|uniref:DNA mismatch repair protein n=1 Tax=Theileria equi strain WA TaxID=1537102 RepID=L0AXW0_THEEQ|nr:DNA mismatch repair protein, putative [Theileria equi strain WA]AFZ80397.1 DNA mismatch repair protein, putative [Theileria equi strain WA]|eukprot:XP_004830063.1 DNA mismatch repair protein, putative [Theileria equi strain WA]
MDKTKSQQVKHTSIKSFFKPRIKSEPNSQESTGDLPKYASLFDKETETTLKDDVYDSQNSIKGEYDEKVTPRESLYDNLYIKEETTIPEADAQPTGNGITDLFFDDESPGPRKRVLVFDEADLPKTLKIELTDDGKNASAEKTHKDILEDSLDNPKFTHKKDPDDETIDDLFKSTFGRSSVEEYYSLNTDDDHLTPEEEEDSINTFEYDENRKVDNENLTVGNQKYEPAEDHIDDREREKYMTCKASTDSRGFKEYVENYYRYRISFLFPPWIDPSNIKDIDGNRPTDENYNPSTLWIPPKGHKWATEFKSCHYTECMQQWWKLKQSHFDSLLFFKMGKFYELFYHDACIIQSLCSLRWMGSETKPHVGFPEKSLHTYASTCVDAGYKVVVIEQTETPQQLEQRNKTEGTSDKAVKRDICEIITPGTITRPEMLGKQSRPLVFISEDEDSTGEYLALLSIDVSMSKIRYGVIRKTRDWSGLKTTLIHLCPAEVVVQKALMADASLLHSIRTLPYPPEITTHMNTDVQESLLLSRLPQTDYVSTCKPVIFLSESYLRCILLDKLIEYCSIEPIEFSEVDAMNLDASALTHLELFLSQEGTVQNSLFKYLNKTATAFGERLLRTWLLSPLVNIESINQRSECVTFLMEHNSFSASLQQQLKAFPDLERALGKILNTAANYYKKAVYFDDGIFSKLHELHTLLTRFERLEDILLDFLHQCISHFSPEFKSDFIQKVSDEFVSCTEDCAKFKNMMQITGVKTCRSATGSWAKSESIQEEIDKVMTKLDDILKNIKETAPSATYINCKFRFEVEISEAEFKRYQKITNKDVEITSTRSGFVRIRNSSILDALEDLEELEFKLKESEEEFYQYIVRGIHGKSFKFCKLVLVASQFDCLSSLATVAKNSPVPMCRPVVHPKSTSTFLDIKGCTYPLFQVNPHLFVPNDISMVDSKGIIVITGPNMGGKSTLLRQVALAVIMAQIGSYVTATSCEFTVVDCIFTRLGASDNLMQGKSTFLVELQDISALLSKATKNSLALVDELGRGTSTFDGTAIAVASLEKISEINCRCIFTTHFQDVCKAAKEMYNVVMYHMAAKIDEESQNVEFLYKLIEGICPESQGLHVAKLAGIPKNVIDIARTASLNFYKTMKGEDLARQILQAHQHNNVKLLQSLYSKFSKI